MSYYELKDNDVFVNTIEAYPDYRFYIHSGTVYINNNTTIPGDFTDNILGVPNGYISLYEYNINRDTSNRIYPFITKGGQKQKFKNISDTEFNTQYGYGGDTITSSYCMSASIERMLITSSTDPNYKKLRSLKSSCNHYAFWSQAFKFENFENTEVNMINIPSIFYGNSLKKGTVSLKYYISGTLAAEAVDSRKNGELLWNDQVVGTVMYNEGLIMLTSSAEIDATQLDYEINTTSSWIRFGYGMNDAATITSTTLSASFGLDFETVSQLQSMTILAKAPYGELNHSNNPTYLKYVNSEPTYTSNSYQFIETNREVKNVVHALETDIEPPFKKETFISKICIYDKDKNLIGTCKLATPLRKSEVNEYLFKLQLDL